MRLVQHRRYADSAFSTESAFPRALQHSALCGPGVILLDTLAGSCDAALMKRREDRARADGVHTNALRRMVGGERPRQARDRRLGGVVLKVAAARDDGAYGGDVNDGASP